MEGLAMLRQAVASFLRSKKLEVFEEVKVPCLSKLNVSEVAIQLYTTYRLLKSGRKEIIDKMFPEGFKVDLLVWYEGKKVPAFAIILSERPDENMARGLDDVAAYYKLLVHLEDVEPRRAGNTVLLSYRDLEEHIGTMLALLTEKVR